MLKSCCSTLDFSTNLTTAVRGTVYKGSNQVTVSSKVCWPVDRFRLKSNYYDRTCICYTTTTINENKPMHVREAWCIEEIDGLQLSVFIYLGNIRQCVNIRIIIKVFTWKFLPAYNWRWKIWIWISWCFFPINSLAVFLGYFSKDNFYNCNCSILFCFKHNRSICWLAWEFGQLIYSLCHVLRTWLEHDIWGVYIHPLVNE